MDNVWQAASKHGVPGTLALQVETTHCFYLCAHLCGGINTLTLSSVRLTASPWAYSHRPACHGHVHCKIGV